MLLLFTAYFTLVSGCKIKYFFSKAPNFYELLFANANESNIYTGWHGWVFFNNNSIRKEEVG